MNDSEPLQRLEREIESRVDEALGDPATFKKFDLDFAPIFTIHGRRVMKKLAIVFVSLLWVACGQKTPDPQPTSTEREPVPIETTETSEEAAPKPDLPVTVAQESEDEPSPEVVTIQDETETTNREVTEYPKGGKSARACKKDSDCVVTHIDGNCCKGCRARSMNRDWIEKVAAYCTSERRENCRGRRTHCKPQPTAVECERNVCVLKTEADDRPLQILDD